MATRSPLIYATPEFGLGVLPSLENEDDNGVHLKLWTCSVGKAPFVGINHDELPHHLLSYSLTKTNACISTGRRELMNKPGPPGELLMTGPEAAYRRIVMKENADIFGVRISNKYLAKCLEETFDKSVSSQGIQISDDQLMSDAVLKHLVHSLTILDIDGGPSGSCFVDSVGLAIAMQLLGRYGGRKFFSSGVRQSKLPDWRLKRVRDYIEANLATSIRLHDLSAVAGLGRTQFAAQFRATVGCPPHVYVLQRRIMRAQRLLMESELSTMDVALVVGFRTHSHFTAVFRRIVGETPTRWRASFEG